MKSVGVLKYVYPGFLGREILMFLDIFFDTSNYFGGHSEVLFKSCMPFQFKNAIISITNLDMQCSDIIQLILYFKITPFQVGEVAG